MPGGVTLGILAGGRAMRLGGADKAALCLGGETLLARTVAAFADPADAERLLSHRAGEDVASGHALRIIHDLRPGQPGPLAGLEALLANARTRWLLTAPVDLRDVPADLGARLRAGAPEQGDIVVVVRDADGLQPLVALWPVASSLLAVRAALDAGRRAARDLVQALPHRVLDIAPSRLGNLNLPADFAA